MLAMGEGMVTVASQVVRYSVGGTEVEFDVDPARLGGAWQDAGLRPGDVVGAVKDAVGPALDAAKVVLERIREINPGSVEVKFGITVGGGANWGIAKAAAEGSFEVTLTWPGPGGAAKPE
jgi:hypothetical protein